MPKRPNRTVAAKLLLSPADLDRFRIWHNRSGVFSSALQYHRFKDPQAHGYNTLSAQEILARVYADQGKFCGHQLHPTAKQAGGYCPVCMVWFCLDFLDAIREKFVEVGGPFGVIKRKRATYFELRAAWFTARLELAALASRYEVAMAMEKTWDMERPGDARHRGTTYSATAAMQLMHKRYKYPAPVASSKKASRRKTMIPDRDKESKQKKTVRFAADLKPYTGRPSHRFLRHHPGYVPGRHSAPRDSQWEDTSFYKSNSYARQQSKVFVITQRANESIDLNKPEQWPKFEGLACFHPKGAMIEEPIEGVLREMLPKDRTEFSRDCESANGIAIIVNDAKTRIVGCNFLTRDIDNSPYPRVYECEWISMKEGGEE